MSLWITTSVNDGYSLNMSIIIADIHTDLDAELDLQYLFSKYPEWENKNVPING